MRKSVAAAAAVLVAASAAYTAAWFYGASQLKHAIAEWKQDAAEKAS